MDQYQNIRHFYIAQGLSKKGNFEKTSNFSGRQRHEGVTIIFDLPLSPRENLFRAFDSL